MLGRLKVLVFLLALGGVGLGSAQSDCADCMPNVIHQSYTSTFTNVFFAPDATENVYVKNEGILAGIIVAPDATATSIIYPDTTTNVVKTAPFNNRIDQILIQSLSNIGSAESGARGTTMNKAIQASWIQNKGIIESDPVISNPIIKVGNSYTFQKTDQSISDMTNYDFQDKTKIYNADSKLAMIVDNINAVIDMTTMPSF